MRAAQPRLRTGGEEGGGSCAAVGCWRCRSLFQHIPARESITCALKRHSPRPAAPARRSPATGAAFKYRQQSLHGAGERPLRLREAGRDGQEGTAPGEARGWAAKERSGDALVLPAEPLSPSVVLALIHERKARLEGVPSLA